MAERDPFNIRAYREGNKQLQGLNSNFFFFCQKDLGLKEVRLGLTGEPFTLGLVPGGKKANKIPFSYPTQH